MNQIFFGCKRAFHGCLHITRPPLTSFGLTAARFDMLTAIRRFPKKRVRQRELVAMLGVTAPVVSRMLRSLEKLALITRDAVLGDRRQRCVELTKRGRKLLRLATHALIDSGACQLAVDCALSENRAWDKSLCFVQMDTADSVLRRLRNAFGDFAELYYPWHPDD